MKQRDFTSQEKKYYKGSISILSFLQPTNPHYSTLPVQLICLIPPVFGNTGKITTLTPFTAVNQHIWCFAEDNGDDDSMEVFWWVKYGHI